MMTFSHFAEYFNNWDAWKNVHRFITFRNTAGVLLETHDKIERERKTLFLSYLNQSHANVRESSEYFRPCTTFVGKAYAATGRGTTGTGSRETDGSRDRQTDRQTERETSREEIHGTREMFNKYTKLYTRINRTMLHLDEPVSQQDHIWAPIAA